MFKINVPAINVNVNTPIHECQTCPSMDSLIHKCVNCGENYRECLACEPIGRLILDSKVCFVCRIWG